MPPMRNLMRIIAAAAVLASSNHVLTQSPSDPIATRSRQLHERAIVVDTHIDTTQRLVFDPKFDLATRHTDGNIDLPRIKEGGLDAAFFSIWVPGDVTGPTAVKRAMDQIDAVREAVRTHPAALVLATTAADAPLPRTRLPR